MKRNTTTFYYIFKTDNKSGKTVHVCNGSHDTEEQVYIHWQSYLYGYMDAMLETDDFSMTEGSHQRSFRVQGQGRDLEYFMLMNKEGQDLVFKLANE